MLNQLALDLLPLAAQVRGRFGQVDGQARRRAERLAGRGPQNIEHLLDVVSNVIQLLPIPDVPTRRNLLTELFGPSSGRVIFKEFITQSLPQGYRMFLASDMSLHDLEDTELVADL